MQSDSHARSGRLLRNVAAALTARMLQIAIRVGWAAASLRFLSQERYALWTVGASLGGWVGFAELGIGAGLINVAASSSSSASMTLRRLVTVAAFAVPVLTGIASSIIFGLFHPGAQLSTTILRLSPASSIGRETPLFITTQIILSLVTLGVTFAAPIFIGLQKGALISALSVAASAVSLVLFSAGAKASCSFAYLAVLNGGPQILLHAGLAVFLFTQVGGVYVDRQSFQVIRDVLRNGGALFAVTIADRLITQFVPILIVRCFGLLAFASYNVAFTALMFLSSFMYELGYAFWPSIREAAANGDWQWVRRKRLNLYGMTLGILSIGAFTFFVFGPRIIKIVANKDIRISSTIYGALTFYFVSLVFANSSGVLMNAMGPLKARMLLRWCVALWHLISFAGVAPHSSLALATALCGLAYCAEGIAGTLVIERILRRRCANHTAINGHAHAKLVSSTYLDTALASGNEV